jgi:hypothetical protein
LSDIRHAMRDERRWFALATVVAPSDGSAHWRVELDGSESVDVMVDVVLQPSQIAVSARLAAGVWVVPRIGEEVVVGIPDGRIDFLPSIVGILSSNSVPTTQGPTPDRMVLERTEIVAHDGAGGAVPVAIASDLSALKTAIQNTVVVPNDGGASFKSTLLSALSGWPHPTTVFKAK